MPSINSSRDKGLVQSSGRGSSFTDLAADSFGLRIHQEKITLTAALCAAADTDGHGVAAAAYYLPAGSSILHASLTNIDGAGTGGTGAVTLGAKANAAVALGGASGATEIAGAGASAVKGSAIDLKIGTGGAAGDTIVANLGFQGVAGQAVYLGVVASSDPVDDVTPAGDLLLTVVYVGGAPVEV